MQCEPVLDIAGELGCLCFLGRGDRARKQIQGLAESLVGGQAMLLFPEGANFSWPRWRKAITQLRSTRGLRAARRALRQSHTLPPRSGGAAAAVAGAPNASILVVTHNGFCADGRDRPWWQLPIHRQLLIRTVVVPAGRIHRRLGWDLGSNEPGHKSMPGSPLMSSSPDVLQPPHPA